MILQDDPGLRQQKSASLKGIEMNEMVLQNDSNELAVAMGDNTVKNMRQLARLISDMSKYTVLVAISIISSLTVLVLSVLWILIDPLKTNRILRIKYNILIICIDSLINSICLILQFIFAKQMYKICCNKCHIMCENRYTKQTNQHTAGIDGAKKLTRLPSGALGFQVNEKKQNENDDNNNDNDNDNDNDDDINLGANPQLSDIDFENGKALAVGSVAARSVDTFGA